MKYLNKIIIALTVLLTSISVKAQDDFDVKLSETEINKTLNAIIAARGLNFGKYYGGTGVNHWIANIDAAHIDIQPNNIVKLEVDDMYFLTDIDLALVDFTVTEHIQGVIEGVFVLRGNETDGFNIVLQLNSIDIDSWGDLGGLPAFIANLFYSEELLAYIPEINLSLTDITPDFFTEAFNLGDPPINTDNESVYLNFNVIGDRFVTVANELLVPNAPQQITDEGYVYHLENGSFVPYPSCFEFAWDLNSNHTIKPEVNGIDYSVDNSHYKYKNWKDDRQLPAERDITVSEDYWYYARFYKSYTVNFSATYEGVNGSFGNININGTDYALPKSEYIFAYPLGEQVSVNPTFSHDGHEYKFINWSDGNSANTRVVSPTTETSLTANYKGTQLTNDPKAFAQNNQNKVLQTEDGSLFMTYTSLGQGWLEKSTDGGKNWDIIIYDSWNEFSPMLTIDNSDKNKFYLLDIYDNHIEYRKGDSHSASLSSETSVPGTNGIASDATYSAVTTVNGDLILFYENKNANDPGIYYTALKNDNGVLTSGASGKIDGTNSFSTSVTVAIDPSPSDKMRKYHVHLAWEEKGKIYYSEVLIAETMQGIEQSNKTNISDAAGYTTNNKPTISYSHDRVQVAWHGYKKVLGRESKGAVVYNNIVVREKASSWGACKIYGEDADYPHIVADFNHNDWSLAWTETGGNDKCVRGSVPTILNMLDGQSKDVQNYNQSDLSKFQAVGLNTGNNPYEFTEEHIRETSKGEGDDEEQYYVAREGVITKEGVGFYFAYGDILVNGKTVEFKSLEDTLAIENLSTLNNYLESEPFEITPETDFYFSIALGVTDDSLASLLLNDEDYVKFKLTLIDARNGGLLGEYDEVTFTKDQTAQYKNIAYKVNTQDIGSAEVKLVLSVEHNLTNEAYGLGKIYSRDEAVIKNGYEQIAGNGSLKADKFTLMQNYPNPFNPTTTIEFAVARRGNYELSVFNVLGEKITTLLRGNLERGKYKAKFDGGQLASGVYIYRLQGNNVNISEKMILMK